MATFKLTRWNVSIKPAHVDVTLHGVRSIGFFGRRRERFTEHVRVARLSGDSQEVGALKRIVRRAMAQAANGWRGRP